MRTLDSYHAPVTAPIEGTEFAAMSQALRAHDPGALILLFCMAGGTEAKIFSRLKIDRYGFTPSQHPPGFLAERYVHGVDERIPIHSLRFGAPVLMELVSGDHS